MSMRELLNNPSRRVFHIAPECYIIFGGTDTADKDLFIRFGNYPDLPALVLQKTTAIACTAAPLGDIFFELAHSDKRSEDVFIGLPQIIRRYKALFGYSTVQAIKYESVTSDKPEQGIYIHYTGDEQLDIRSNNKPFFSLSARAKQDRHYHIVVDNAYTLVRRMRMAHGEQQLAEHGFYMVDGGVNAYAKHTALAINPHPNFVVAHAARGFDPAVVDSAYFSDARSLALYRLLMHARAHKLKGAILVGRDADMDIVKRMCSFVGYPYKHTGMSQYKKIPFQELTISVSQNQKVVKITGANNLRVTIDTDKQRWKAYSGPDSGGDMLYDGLLYRWDLSKQYTWSQLRNRFLPKSFDVGTHNIPFSEREFLANGLRCLDSTSDKLLKNALRRIKALRRKCTKHPSRFFMFALANVNHIAHLALEDRSKSTGSYALLKKAVSIFKSTYSSVQHPSPQLDGSGGISIFPGMSAILVHTNQGIQCVIDYQWNRDALYAQHDDELCKNIAGFVSERNAKYYADELKRLYALIDKVEGKQGSHKSVTEHSDSADNNADAESDAQSSKRIRRSRKRGRHSAAVRRPLRSFGVVGAVLFVLVGLLFGLDYFGVLRVGDTIGRLSQWVGDTINRSDQRSSDRTTANQQRDAADNQSAQQDSQTQGNDSRGDVLGSTEFANGVDIEVLRNAVTDDTNLNSPWLTLSTPFGAVNITVGEIIATTNLIAINSGFRTLGDDSSNAPDPDLIYPEGVLRLPPDTAQYNIVLNDTMWGVAENLIVEQVKDHIGTLATIYQQLDTGAGVTDVASTTAVIEEIINNSYCADVKAIATSLLNRL